MTPLLWNLVLALLWAAVRGRVDGQSLLTGFVLGFLLLAFLDPNRFPSAYAARTWGFVRLVGRVAWEVVTAALQVARDVITPHIHARPAIFRYEMEARTDAEITLLSLIVTYTPGTLGLEVSEDRKALYVHVMFATDRESFCRRLHEWLEQPLLRVLR
ncbi:MAG: Na+/H+ antiporter subunit E [Myxococcaceae bacterium]|nr:Na+/H+ antiporter subunit E [Myxococcaceae bacterium]